MDEYMVNESPGRSAVLAAQASLFSPGSWQRSAAELRGYTHSTPATSSAKKHPKKQKPQHTNRSTGKDRRNRELGGSFFTPFYYSYDESSQKPSSSASIVAPQPVKATDESVSSSYDSNDSMSSGEYSALLDYLANAQANGDEQDLTDVLAALGTGNEYAAMQAAMDVEGEPWVVIGPDVGPSPSRRSKKDGPKRPKGGWEPKLSKKRTPKANKSKTSSNRASPSPSTPMRPESTHSTPGSYGKKGLRASRPKASPLPMAELKQRYGSMMFVAAIDPASKLVDDDALIVVPHSKAMAEAFAADPQHEVVEIVDLTPSDLTEESGLSSTALAVAAVDMTVEFSEPQASSSMMDCDPPIIVEVVSIDTHAQDESFEDSQDADEEEDSEDYEEESDSQNEDYGDEEEEEISEEDLEEDAIYTDEEEDLDSQEESEEFDTNSSEEASEEDDDEEDDEDDDEEEDSSDAGSEEDELPAILLPHGASPARPASAPISASPGRRGTTPGEPVQMKHDMRRRKRVSAYSRNQPEVGTFSSNKKLNKQEKKKQKKKNRDEIPFEYRELETWNELIRNFIQNNTHGVPMPFSPMGRYQRKQLHWLSEFYGLRSQSFGSGTRRSTSVFVTKRTIIPDLALSLAAIKAISQGNHPFGVSSEALENEARQLERKTLTPKPQKKSGRAQDRGSVEKSPSIRQKKKMQKAGRSPLVGSRGKAAAKGKGGRPQRGRSMSGNWDSEDEEAAAHRGLGSLSSSKRLVGAGADHIPESNVGHALLRKLGWSAGGLGKDQQGIAHPIQAEIKAGRRGLGS